MKLTAKQISEIDSYINTFNIDYYELKQEFLDHMVCSVEAILDQKQIDLKEAIIEAKLDFQPLGFRGIMEERQAELRKQYKKEHWNSIKDFFKFPQVVGTISLFISFYIVLGLFLNALKVGNILIIIGFGFMFFEFIKLYKLRKKEKQLLLRVETFLSEKLMLATILPQSFFNFFNGFKGSLDVNNSIIKIIVSLVLTYSFLSLIVFTKVARKEIYEVKRLYFS